MSTKIYVGNLSWQATAEDLSQAFGQYGEVRPARAAAPEGRICPDRRVPGAGC
jgi:RNA recognition motif-containing protein